MRTPPNTHSIGRSSALAALTLVTAAALAAALALPSMALAWQPGVPLSTPFPRLAMWWPNTSTQSATQLARYDWLALTDVDRPAIASIRALHPDEILLNSTNACELDLDPWSTPTSASNATIAKLPAQWLLTQVGTTLSAPITASATSIPVTALTASNSDGKTVTLFATGETVVVDGEIMYVSAIDSANRVLTVRRGFAKPAATHSAGTRIAATVSFWPRSVLVDLTSSCPRITVDSSVGPETWAEYNARIGAALATDAAWDGVLVDRSDGNESWLVDSYYANSIDLDRSNRVPGDYDDFDQAWNAGLTGYELRLRGLVGSGKLIVSNWGYPNFSLLNGTNFEDFPSVSDADYPWQRLVEGPDAEHGSYFDWLANAPQPDLTNIQTYQDESLPSAGGDGSYTNPATQPGFVPNYAKMRYGLTTALLGDGFFSYEVSASGHGSLGLMWFDEYDGAGRGRGYLGQPTAAAQRVWDPLPTADGLSGDGAFDSQAQMDRWTLQTVAPASATAVRDTATLHAGTGSMRVNVGVADGVTWDAKTYHPLAVTAGKEYTLTFWARSDTARTMDSWIQQAHSPWNDVAYLGVTQVTPQWQHFSLTATSSTTDANSWIVLAFGASTGTVWVDDVQVRQGNPNVWRRTFGNGVSVVNATHAAATVPLGGIYRNLQGTQVPSVNDGHLVSSLTIGPHDGSVAVTTNVVDALPFLDTAWLTEKAAIASASRSGALFTAASKSGSSAARAKAAARARLWNAAASAEVAAANQIGGARASLAAGALAGPPQLDGALAAATEGLRQVRVAYANGPLTAGQPAVGNGTNAVTLVHFAAYAPR